MLWSGDGWSVFLTGEFGCESEWTVLFSFCGDDGDDDNESVNVSCFEFDAFC